MATKVIAWNTGAGNITLTYNGQGDGTVSVTSDPNTVGSIRSQTIVIKTTQGGVVTKNVTINQAACPFPIGDVKSYSYTGSVQSVLLPAGSYKLQCWGAQGGSNEPNSTYGIVAKTGGKGGYSEGVLTLASPTTIYIFVGGQGGSSGNGGWNCGGGGNGTSQANYDNTLGYTKVGCGGGATDIALVTSSMSYSSYRNDRSAASLLSRMIVAGGGSGGCMNYTATTSTTETLVGTFNLGYDFNSSSGKAYCINSNSMLDITTLGIEWNSTYRVVLSNPNIVTNCDFVQRTSTNRYVDHYTCDDNGIVVIGSQAASTNWLRFVAYYDSETLTGLTVTIYKRTTSTTTSNNFQEGYVGGGTNGGGESGSVVYRGRQNTAGSGGEFGKGANQKSTGYRYHGGLGGGGWYGGGNGAASTSDPANVVKASGGGSGFVNIHANAQYRPDGYTGLELDSGNTYDGNSSFPNTTGTGNETGHSGNGYAKITRLS